MATQQTSRVQTESLYRLISFISPILFLFTWETLVRTNILDYRFFPAPTMLVEITSEMIASGELWQHVSISLMRVLAGFALGATPAVIVGLLMGWFRAIHAFLDPIISAIYPVPKIALLPLFLIIFGLGEMTKIVTIAVAVFFIVLITTVNGVRLVDTILIDVARSYGAKGWRLFAQVIFPATLPAIFTGLRLGLGISLLVIVGSEFVAANSGIGYLIWMSWATLTVKKMYVGLVVIALLGILSTQGVERLRKVMMPWAQDFHTPR